MAPFFCSDTPMTVFNMFKTGFPKRWQALFLLLLALCHPAKARADAAAVKEYAERLVGAAEGKKLWDERYWHLLLHYKRGLLGGFTSEVMEPAFFNSPDGRTDPESELKETIRSLFKPIDALKAGEEHPLCNFPARRLWLSEKLEIDQTLLPRPVCARKDHWMASLDVNRVTLVYASYYMASPASMFGHTLLRLDKKGENSNQVLLNYGVNYAANMNTDNPILMAYKGMFGLFPGVYSTFPYYMKVQEYSNIEARDMWEYQLALDPQQIHVLLLHLWEVGEARFQYFYFRENCAFEMLALIEVANPALHLTEQFPVATVPTKTVKAVCAEEGLVTARVYRPSLIHQLDQRRHAFSVGQAAAFKDILKANELAPSAAYGRLGDGEKAAVLDAYLDYRQYQVMRSRKSEDEGLLRQNRAILMERARLPQRTADDSVPVERGPEQGHDSNKLSLGGGANNAGPFEFISYRPTYHDLMSYAPGYADNSQIIYFETSVRHYNQTGKTILEGVKLVDLVSLSPYDPLYGNTSWQVSFGFRSLRDIGCEECQAFYVNFGDGYAVKTPVSDSAILYAMLTGRGEVANRFAERYRIGVGLEAGGLIEETDSLKTHIFLNAVRYPAGNITNEYRFGLRQRYAFDKNFAVGVAVSRINDDNEVMVNVDAYY